MGHPSIKKMLFVIPVESFISSFGCETCELSKHYRATFQNRVNSPSNSAFELVHSDVWGPSYMPSIKGCRYFLLC